MVDKGKNIIQFKTIILSLETFTVKLSSNSGIILRRVWLLVFAKYCKVDSMIIVKPVSISYFCKYRWLPNFTNNFKLTNKKKYLFV